MGVSDPIECSIFGVVKIESNSFFCRLVHTLWCACSQTVLYDLLTCIFVEDALYEENNCYTSKMAESAAALFEKTTQQNTINAKGFFC